LIGALFTLAFGVLLWAPIAGTCAKAGPPETGAERTRQ